MSIGPQVTTEKGQCEPSRRRLRAALSFPGCHTRGGVERILLECARYLTRRGHDVHVFASDFGTASGQEVFSKHFVPVHPRPRWLRGRRYLDAATLAVARGDFDVLNTHGVVCPLGGVQWVQSLHAAWLERCRQVRRPWEIARIKQRLNPLHPALLDLERRHFRVQAYSRLIATTPKVREDLGRFYGVPERDVDIVPNGFNPTEFNPTHRRERRLQCREQLGLAESDFAILFAANELERKGLPVLLRAVARINDPRIRIIAAGRPPIRCVMNYATRYGVSRQTLAVGGERRLADLHAAADVMVLPTQYEAFCLAILESLGSGLPVITTSVPGARDAIIADRNGQIVDDPLDVETFAQAIRGYLSGDSLARASAIAPMTVSQYQWPSVLERYEEILCTYARSEQ